MEDMYGCSVATQMSLLSSTLYRFQNVNDLEDYDFCREVKAKIQSYGL
jgi:hypothetical protein